MRFFSAIFGLGAYAKLQFTRITVSITQAATERIVLGWCKIVLLLCRGKGERLVDSIPGRLDNVVPTPGFMLALRLADQVDDA